MPIDISQYPTAVCPVCHTRCYPPEDARKCEERHREAKEMWEFNGKRMMRAGKVLYKSVEEVEEMFG